MNKYLYIFRVYVHNQLFFKSQIVSTLIVFMIRMGMLALVYSYVFGLGDSEVNNIDVTVAIWSIYIYGDYKYRCERCISDYYKRS